MRRFFLLGLFITLLYPVSSQIVPDCIPVELQKLDSIIHYSYDSQTYTYSPVELFRYQFDGVSEYPVIDRISLPSRQPINRQNYFYSTPPFKAFYILQEWNGTEFQDRSRTDYRYRSDGLIEREIFSGFDGTVWIPYQQHIFNYDELNITRTYLRQMMYTPGIWTDFSYKNYVYDDSGRLIERNEQRIADGVIFWVELFTYDDADRVASRVRQSLKYNPQTRTYDLTNLNRQRYSYDRFGDLSGYLTDTWTNGLWVLTGKSSYFRSYIYDKEIPICFRGKTKTVSVKVAVRLFNYGALPGSCECLADGLAKSADEGGGAFSQPGGEGLTVYPNPALSSITVMVPERPAIFSDISIYDRNGTLVQRNHAGSREERVDISSLSPGTYYLVVTGEGESLMTSFIKTN